MLIRLLLPLHSMVEISKLQPNWPVFHL